MDKMLEGRLKDWDFEYQVCEYMQEAGFFDAFKPLYAFDEVEEGKEPTKWWIRLLFGLASATLLYVLYYFAPDRGMSLFVESPLSPSLPNPPPPPPSLFSIPDYFALDRGVA